MKTVLTSALASLALLAACATPYAAPVNAQSGALTNPEGMTLYVFDKDAAGSGKSACNGDCAMNWPPLTATAGDKAGGDYSIITRDDGKEDAFVHISAVERSGLQGINEGDRFEFDLEVDRRGKYSAVNLVPVQG